MARPMPLPAPVTNAFFPFNDSILYILQALRLVDYSVLLGKFFYENFYANLARLRRMPEKYNHYCLIHEWIDIRHP
jgi:hypothetical protein